MQLHPFRMPLLYDGSWSMPRQSPGDLADEIRSGGGPWSLSFARFRPDGDKAARSLRVSIAISGGNVWSDIALDSRPLRQARGATDTFARSGYEILRIHARPFHARRRLRGSRELDAEVRRLEGLWLDPAALRSFPARAPRELGLPVDVGSFSTESFDRLREAHGWILESVSAGRAGPARFVRAPGMWTGAWCFADGETEPPFDLHVQLVQKQADESIDSSAFARIARQFRDRLAPIGYVAFKLRGQGRRAPRLAVLDKGVRTLAGARRERGRLDRILFCD
jgi:hypothetical protein